MPTKLKTNTTNNSSMNIKGKKEGRLKKKETQQSEEVETDSNDKQKKNRTYR